MVGLGVRADDVVDAVAPRFFQRGAQGRGKEAGELLVRGVDQGGMGGAEDQVGVVGGAALEAVCFWFCEGFRGFLWVCWGFGFDERGAEKTGGGAGKTGGGARRRFPSRSARVLCGVGGPSRPRSRERNVQATTRWRQADRLTPNEGKEKEEKEKEKETRREKKKRRPSLVSAPLPPHPNSMSKRSRSQSSDRMQTVSSARSNV